MSEINDLAKSIRECDACLLRKKAKCPIPGVGKLSARVMAVGQAPGWEENREGVPWVGQAGQFLSAVLDSVGLDSSQVYFTNIAKCFPGKKRGGGGDAEPPPFAIQACQVHLKAEIELIKPEVIMAVGAVAMRFFGIKGGVNQNSGRAFDTPWGKVIPVLHPAGLMRVPRNASNLATQVHAINTALRPPLGLPAPLYEVKPKRHMEFGLDTEVEDGEIWCAGIATDKGKLAHQWQEGDGVTAIMAEARAKPVIQNAKYDIPKLEAKGVVFEDWEDTILEAHMLGYKPLNLVSLADVFLGVQLDKTFVKQSMAKGRNKVTFDQHPEEVLEGCGMDAWAALKLHELFAPQLKERGLWELYQREKKVSRVLMGMEATGLPVDQTKLKHGKRMVLRRMGQVESLLKAHGIPEPGNTEFIGQKFWRKKKRVITTKTGELSTKAKDLRENMNPDEEPWVEGVIEWRQLAKFKSTYLDNWEGHDWIHPSVNQTGTMTWRFSMSDPNLQNVAKSKTVPLYQLFVAPEGWTFISADYSQGELRVLANQSQDANMLNAYLSGRDLHTETVAFLEEMGLFKMYGITDPDDKRRFAKTVNFGIAYGITDYGLAPRLKLPKGKAQPFIDGFYRAYPGVPPWQAEQIAHGIQYGYVETFAGRPLYVPCVMAERGKLYYHGEKQCMNYPIQGGLMEVVKDAMVRASQYLVNQVHDEVLYLVPKAEAEEYKRFLAEALVDNRHDVPYTIDIKTGDTWGDIKNIVDIWVEDEEDDDD
jgi:uracil-DNA glycosylase family 4